MNLIVPDPQDAAQLLRLRVLRVTRARERCGRIRMMKGATFIGGDIHH